MVRHLDVGSLGRNRQDPLGDAEGGRIGSGDVVEERSDRGEPGVAGGDRGSSIEVTIPPRADAVLSTADPHQQSLRDRHLQLLAERGRIGWQRATEYGRRNHAETIMSRYKHLIGPKLRARSRPGQHGEAALAVQVLNRTIRTAKPVSVRR